MKYKYNSIKINIIIALIFLLTVFGAIDSYEAKEFWMFFGLLYVLIVLPFFARFLHSICFEITEDALIHTMHPPFDRFRIKKIYFKDIIQALDDHLFNPNWEWLHYYSFFSSDGKRIEIPGALKNHQYLVSEVLKKTPKIRKTGSFAKIYLWDRKQSINMNDVSRSEDYKYKGSHIFLSLFCFPAAFIGWSFMFYYMLPYVRSINVIFFLGFGSLCAFTLFYYALLIRYLTTKFWYTDEAVFMKTFTKRGVAKFIYARWENIIDIKNTGRKYIIQQDKHETITIPFAIKNHQEIIKKILANKPKRASLTGDFSIFR